MVHLYQTKTALAQRQASERVIIWGLTRSLSRQSVKKWSENVNRGLIKGGNDDVEKKTKEEADHTKKGSGQWKRWSVMRVIGWSGGQNNRGRVIEWTQFANEFDW